MQAHRLLFNDALLLGPAAPPGQRRRLVFFIAAQALVLHRAVPVVLVIPRGWPCQHAVARARRAPAAAAAGLCSNS